MVVRIVQLSIGSPCGFVHLSHRPAKANTPVIYFEAIRLFGPAFPLPLVEPVGWNQATLRFEGFPERCGVATVSALALIVLYPMPGSFAHDGTSPHRMVESFGEVRGILADRQDRLAGQCYSEDPSSYLRSRPEILLDKLLSPRQSVTSAHEGIIAD